MLVVIEVSETRQIPIRFPELSQHTDQRPRHSHTIRLRVTYEQLQTAIGIFSLLNLANKHKSRLIHHPQSGYHWCEGRFYPICSPIALDLPSGNLPGLRDENEIVLIDPASEFSTSVGRGTNHHNDCVPCPLNQAIDLIVLQFLCGL